METLTPADKHVTRITWHHIAASSRSTSCCMSAFAALQAPSRLGSLHATKPPPLNSAPRTLNFSFRRDNVVLRPDSITLGLEERDLLILQGCFEAEVLRGVVFVDGAIPIRPGSLHKFITSPLRSLPTFRTVDARKVESDGHGILPRYGCVVQLRSLELGLDHFASYSSLDIPYSDPAWAYSFNIVQEESPQTCGAFIPGRNLLALEKACQLFSSGPPRVVMVAGAPMTGKSTFCETLLNCVLAENSSIAYMDLDPSHSRYSPIGCISLSVQNQPRLNAIYSVRGLEFQHSVYYGFNLVSENPLHFYSCASQLFRVYTESVRSNGTLLVVNTPAWIKGLEKEMLVMVSRLVAPDLLLYMSHHDFIPIGDYVAPTFESQDHPDSSVLQDVHYGSQLTLRAIRKLPLVSKSDFLDHNKLIHFHQLDSGIFSFRNHLLLKAPQPLSYWTPSSPSGTVRAVCFLNYERDQNLVFDDVVDGLEATVMAICAVSKSDVSNAVATRDESPWYLDAEGFRSISSYAIGLCMVHSVDTRDHTFNIYPDGELGAKIAGLSPSETLILVRGEGEIPQAEFEYSRLSGAEIPFLNADPKTALGGRWTVRKNIGRASQK